MPGFVQLDVSRGVTEHGTAATDRAAQTPIGFEGRLLEVRAELSGKVELRFDPSRSDLLPKVFVANRFVCDTVLLDRLVNSRRVRRQNVSPPSVWPEPSGLDPLALIQAEHELRTRPIPGAFSQQDAHDDEDNDDSTED